MNRDFKSSTGRDFFMSRNRDRVSLMGAQRIGYQIFSVIISTPRDGPVLTESGVTAKRAEMFSLLAGIPFPETQGTLNYDWSLSGGPLVLNNFQPDSEDVIAEGGFNRDTIRSVTYFEMSHAPRFDLGNRLTMIMTCKKLKLVFTGAMISPFCIYQHRENNTDIIFPSISQSAQSCFKSRLLSSGDPESVSDEMYAFDPENLTVQYGPDKRDPTSSEMTSFVTRRTNGNLNVVGLGLFRTYRMASGKFMGFDGASHTITALLSGSPGIAPCCNLT